MPDPKKNVKLDITVEGAQDTSALSAAVMAHLLDAAKAEKLDLQVENVKGKPFRVISKPGGGVMWGVGGCGIGG